MTLQKFYWNEGVTVDTQIGNFGAIATLGELNGDVANQLSPLDANRIPFLIRLMVTGNNGVFGNYFDPDENITFDNTYFKIREVALSYELPKSKFPKSPFDHIDFTISGRNMFFYAPGFPSGFNFIPETRDMRTPSTKRYSFSITLNF